LAAKFKAQSLPDAEPHRPAVALFEEHPDFGRGAIDVVGVHFNDHGHVVRGSIFSSPMPEPLEETVWAVPPW
jgi:hypothetical protein